MNFFGKRKQKQKGRNNNEGCPHCGNRNADEGQQCSKCGGRVPIVCGSMKKSSLHEIISVLITEGRSDLAKKLR